MDETTATTRGSGEKGQISAEQVSARLSAMFSEVLGVGPVRPDNDFFALGGHSLAAGKIIGLIRREMGVRVPLADFFDEPTVQGLTKRVLAAQAPPVR